MADFLSRLAARSLGTAPLARPVITPLFAPDPALGVESDAAENEPSDVPGAGAAPARDRLTTPLPTPRSGTFGSEAALRPLETQVVRSVDGRSPDEPAAATSRRVEAAPVEEMLPPTVDPGEVHTASTIGTGPPARAGLPHRDLARPHRSFGPPEAAAEENAPIVRISIGRIEVRAVAAPPAAPRPAAARPDDRVSLADYLKGEARRR